MSPDWSASPEPVPYAKLADPQSLNLYAYVGNNPVNRLDVDGHCSAPTGLQRGQVGICVASYIRTKWFKLLGRGDNRGTSANGGRSRVEVRMIVDPSKHTVQKTYEHVGRSGVVFSEFGLKGGGSNTVNASKDKDGNTIVNVHQTGQSSMALRGIMLGEIENHLNFKVTADGKTTLETGSFAKDFPSTEAYSYTTDGKTTTANKLVDKVESGNGDALYDIEKPVAPKTP